MSVNRIVSAQALVAFGGNFYSVPPGLGAHTLTVTHRLDAATIDIATAAGVVLARHHREPDGAGVIVREAVHVAALEKAVLAAFSTGKPRNRKTRRPPSQEAREQAQSLTSGKDPTDDRDVVVDLAVWAAAASTRQVAP